MPGLIIASFKSLFEQFDKSMLSAEQKKTNLSYTLNIMTKYKSLGVRILLLFDGDPQDVMNYFNGSIVANNQFIPRNDILPEETTFEKKYKSIFTAIKYHNNSCASADAIDLNNSNENIIIIDSNYDYLEYIRQQCPSHLRIKCIHVSCGYDKILEFNYKKSYLENCNSIETAIITELKKIQPEKSASHRPTLRLSANKSALRSSSHSSGGGSSPISSSHERDSILSAETMASSDSNHLLAALNSVDTTTRAKTSAGGDKPLTPRLQHQAKNVTTNVVSTKLPDPILSSEQAGKTGKSSMDASKSPDPILNKDQLKQIFTALFALRASAINFYAINVTKFRFAIREKWEYDLSYYLVSLDLPEDVQHELRLHEQKFDEILKRNLAILESGQDTVVDLLRHFSTTNNQTTKNIKELSTAEHARIAQNMSSSDSELLPYLIDLSISYDKFVALRRNNAQKAILQLKQETSTYIKTLGTDQAFLAQTYEMHLVNLRITIFASLKQWLMHEKAEDDKNLNFMFRNPDSLLSLCTALLTDDIKSELETSYYEALVKCPEYVAKESELLSADSTIKAKKPLLFDNRSGTPSTQTDLYVKLMLLEDPSLLEVVKTLVSKMISAELTSLRHELTNMWLASFDAYFKWLATQETAYRDKFSALLERYSKRQQEITEESANLDQTTKAQIRELQAANLRSSTIFVNINPSVRSRSGSGTGSRIGLRSSVSTTTQDHPLFEACKQRKAQKFQEELAKIPAKELATFINSLTNSSKRTVLDVACQNGHGIFVEQLLQLGANVHLAPSGLQPLFYAVTAVDQDLERDESYCVVSLLLKAGAVVNDTTLDEKQNTPLHKAAINPVGRTITHILKHGIVTKPGSIAIHLINSLGQSAINVALRAGHEKAIEQFYALGIGLPKNEMDALKRDNKDEPITAKQNYLDQLTKREKLFQIEKQRIEQNHPGIFKSIEEKYAATRSRAGSGLFGFFGSPRSVPDKKLIFKSKLLMKFADVNAKLFFADNEIRLLNQCDAQDGVAPIHAVCMSSGPNVDTLDYLLSKQVDVNLVSAVGLTALHYACENGREDLVKILLNTPGIKIIADKNGLTPLHSAAIKGHANIVRLLLEHLCPTQKHYQAQQPYDYATIYQRLSPEGSTINPKPQTAFMKAMLNGHKDVLHAFSEYGFVIGDDDIEQWGSIMDKLGTDKKSVEQKALSVYGICEYLRESRELCAAVIKSPVTTHSATIAISPRDTASPKNSPPPSPVKTNLKSSPTRDKTLTTSPSPAPSATINLAATRSPVVSPVVSAAPPAKTTRSQTAPNNAARPIISAATPAESDPTAHSSFRSPSSPSWQRQ